MGGSKGGGGGAGKKKAGGGGLSAKSNFSSEQQIQIAEQVNKINDLPPDMKQRRLSNARGKADELERRISHMEKLNENARFRAEKDAITRNQIEARKKEIEIRKTQLAMVREVLSRVK